MGVYALSEVKANGAPRFVKRLAGGGAHYLFRNSNSGKWMATDDESDIAKNVGGILSSRAADLPSKAGLGWEYYDGSAWPDDPNLRCTEVTGPAAASPRRARGGGGGEEEGRGRGERGGKRGGKRGGEGGAPNRPTNHPADSPPPTYLLPSPPRPRPPSPPTIPPHPPDGHDAHAHALRDHEQNQDRHQR
jgi:hypothetical protein